MTTLNLTEGDEDETLAEVLAGVDDDLREQGDEERRETVQRILGKLHDAMEDDQ